ncbi:YdcH family protein [Aestuariibius sp. 2305UL40-4]|uniref:YdcH family protein n=1 Tax=Aestuariibius violaceus TaxID=3234132 RepID=UPI00345EF5FC
MISSRRQLKMTEGLPDAIRFTGLSEPVRTREEPRMPTVQRISRRGSLAARIAALSDRHDRLDQAIAEESRRPLPDLYKLRSFKRAKLRLKDEITSHQGILKTLSRSTLRAN